MNKKSIVGIDLGTSSVKVLQKYADGTVVKKRVRYEEISPSAWWKAICDALNELAVEDIAAIGLSSQVGTYIVDDVHVISWNSGEGAEELEMVKRRYGESLFLREISMPHPNIVSYPIPRLLYIKKHYPGVQKVCMPKDFICEMLTGKCVTDPYSWRGLANLNVKEYSQYFLDAVGIERYKLPLIKDYTERAGETMGTALGSKMLPAGIPVYVGLNDYFASLLGMGIDHEGDMFDLTGTSEHLGIIEKGVHLGSEMVTGPYLNECVHYGVTASSGASIEFGWNFQEDQVIDLEEIRKHKPPIFLPYLNGERAPIWDADARGMFFGIQAKCSKEDMAYAVLEGVVFSLYHIYESMGCPKSHWMIVAGGAAVNQMLNRLKAEMFDIPVVTLEENDTSALGAVMAAALGQGWYANLADAISDNCKLKEKVDPTGTHRAWMLKRFEIYKELYPSVKLQYKKWKELES